MENEIYVIKNKQKVTETKYQNDYLIIKNEKEDLKMCLETLKNTFNLKFIDMKKNLENLEKEYIKLKKYKNPNTENKIDQISIGTLTEISQVFN